LRRAAQQENVARWIKRFVILGHYDRAMDFAQQVDWAIERVQYEAPVSESEWLSWRHTLVHGERRCWRAFAMIYAGQDVPDALAELQEEIEKLSKLVECATDEVAVIHRDGFEERGFAGSIERGIPPHPAEMRVRRIVSHAYNVLGYGFITLGQVREAVAAYGLSLYYLRGAKADSHRATVLNNLSRALSDLGRRSERMCLDGLELRRKIGAEVPLAYSYNTLSLIYDDQDRPEDAWVQSAKAVAYFRRAGNARGLGLSLLQLGEALRHIAAQVRRGQTFVSTPDSLYTTSHELLKESREIFSHLSEPLRLMEINIELGCLYRDWFHAENPDGPDPASVQTGKYREALSYFEAGMELAKEKEVAFLVVDALMNTAWAHYYLNRFDEVQEVLTAVVQTIEQEIETKLEERCIIRSDYLPDGTELNNMWVFNQLSKLQSLNGRIAITRFRHRATQIKQEFLAKGQAEKRERHQATRQDVAAQGYLAQAAYAYIFAIEYAILFSPHAATITLIEDNLYNYLKRFNQTELEDFHTHLQAWSSRFPALKGKVQGHQLLEDFLHEFFSLPRHDYE
jgi:tetratricopeptide (TPR) repeat protein